MSILEEKKIVIRVPEFSWSFFWGARFLGVVAIATLAMGFAHWYREVRPFLSIANGRLEAFSAVLSSDASGRIVEMGPSEGDVVRKGQSLFAFDRDLLAAKHTQAKTRLDRLHESIEKEKIQIGKAMETYLALTAELEMGIGSAENVKKQLVLMDEAQARVDEARSQLVAAQTEYEFADLQLKKMSFIAPFDGVILKRYENPGAVVSFGSPVYLLCDRERLWVEVQVPESEISRVAIGTPAKIKLAAYPKKEFHGKVIHISPSTIVPGASGAVWGEKISLRVSIDDAVSALQPGLSASVALKVR